MATKKIVSTGTLLVKYFEFILKFRRALAYQVPANMRPHPSGFDNLKTVRYACTTTSITGCSVAWLTRLLWEQEIVGSNPVTPTGTRHAEVLACTQ